MRERGFQYAKDIIRLGEVCPNFGFDGGGIQIDLQQQ